MLVSSILHRIIGIPVILLFFCGCGRPKPMTVTLEDGRQALELPYCTNATDCFVAADEACPKGYETIRWQASRPHIIVCNSPKD